MGNTVDLKGSIFNDMPEWILSFWKDGGAPLKVQKKRAEMSENHFHFLITNVFSLKFNGILPPSVVDLLVDVKSTLIDFEKLKLIY